jgi:hypothetical protein
MGFIFRTIFWLSAAAVILPPGSRIGGENLAEYRQIDIEHELRSAAFSAWTLAWSASDTCGDNPDLCQSVVALWNTGVETIAAISEQESAAWREASSGQKTSVTSPRSRAEN